MNCLAHPTEQIEVSHPSFTTELSKLWYVCLDLVFGDIALLLQVKSWQWQR